MIKFSRTEKSSFFVLFSDTGTNFIPVQTLSTKMPICLYNFLVIATIHIWYIGMCMLLWFFVICTMIFCYFGINKNIGVLIYSRVYLSIISRPERCQNDDMPLFVTRRCVNGFLFAYVLLYVWKNYVVVVASHRP